MTDTLHVTCPGCTAVNRVPTARLADNPNCGKCDSDLFTGKPLELTAANFDRHVGRSDVPTVVDFWAAWCGPCQQMAPEFARASATVEPVARLAKLDTEAAPDVAARFNIRGIPTLIAFHQGREIARRSGAMSAQQIDQWTRSAVGGDLS